MKYLALRALISALFSGYLLASLQQLVPQAGLSPPAPDAHADPAVGVCWAVTETSRLLIYTPGQCVTAKHLLCRTLISLSPFAAVLHHAATFCGSSFLVSSARIIPCLHVPPTLSSKLNILVALRGNLLRQENAWQDAVLCRGSCVRTPSALPAVTETSRPRVPR